MDENFIYHDNDFIIGTETSLLEAFKERMFYNEIEDNEGIIDFYRQYWDLKEQFKNYSKRDLYMVKFNQMDGSGIIAKDKELAEELVTLVIKGELTIKNK